MHNIFPRLFDLTGIWVAIQALAYGACEVHEGVSAFSPALSRVTGRDAIIRALGSAEVTKPDWGAASAASACHPHRDGGSCLATYGLLHVFLISALHNLTQSCKVRNVYDGFGNMALGTTYSDSGEAMSSVRMASELLAIEKCSSRSDKILRKGYLWHASDNPVLHCIPLLKYKYSGFSKCLFFQT